MKVLITGGAGFIGSNTAEYLLSLGWKVRIFDDLSTGSMANLAGLKVDFLKGDVRNPAALRRAMKGMGRVLHLAALVSVAESVKFPRRSQEVNDTGAFNVFEAAAVCGVGRVVSASSAAVYGNLPGLPKRETMPLRAESPYAAGKLAVEHYASVFSGLYGLETVCLRYFNVFGPKQSLTSQYSGVISRFAAALSDGEKINIFGDGEQTRDFVYVGDVARANALALSRAGLGRGECVNVGTGRSTSLLKLAREMSAVCGQAPSFRFAAARPGDIRHSLPDIALARKLLKFKPAYTLRRGLELTMKAGKVCGAQK
ncbi:MAG: SDR family NAD(P)-dependent oxidoreductase [Elusimicrobiales bacterium]